MSMFRGILRVITSGTAIGFFMTVFTVMGAATSAAAATRTWDGGAADAFWQSPANWAPDGPPSPGDDLVFPAGVVDTATTNNFPAGTKFGSITFGAAYTVDGNRILIASTIEHLGSGTTTISCDVTLDGGLFATGPITLRVQEPNAQLRFMGAIGSVGGPIQLVLRKNGLGRVRLDGANTYGGVTAIEEGELRIYHANALGAITANTVVSDGAVLGVEVAGAPVIAEPLMLAGQGTSSATDGALTFRAQATWSGSIALFGAATAGIGLPYVGPDATITGVISGSNSLVTRGSSVLRLASANEYTGMTYVGSRLVVLHAQALGSPSAGTYVSSGGSLTMEVPEVLNEPLVADTEGSASAVIYCPVPATCTWSGPISLIGVNAFAANAGHTLRLTGDIIGSGSLESSTGGIVELLGNNSYAGNTLVGNLKLTGSHRIPDASPVVFKANGVLDLPSGSAETIGSITGAVNNQIKLGSSMLTFDIAGAGSYFEGVISGSGGLIKKGVGTLMIANAQTYTSTTTVQAGVLRLNQAVLPGPVSVFGGILRGVGSVGILSSNGGRIEPGLSPGILKAQSLYLVSGATLAFELNGPTVGTQYDQLQVTGGVILNGATLELSAPNDAPFNGPFVIVKNDGMNGVSGTFAGLPEGAIVFPANGRALRISYAGGDGNDIVLTPAVPSYYLSEGATGAFFDLDILIANPSTTAVDATLTFLLPNGTTKEETRNVPARSRLTINVDEIAGLESTAVSTVVTSTSGLPLVVERTMRWDASGYGAHTEKAVNNTSKDWYFAEGSQGFFSTYVLLANPQSSLNVATVRYLRENATAIVRTYPVAANSRFTVDAGADSELVGSSFGMHVTFEQPGVAERAMYFGVDPFWKAGHESAGVIEPSATWFLAEGATGPFFETFVLLANPGDQPAEATVTFLPDTGVPVVKIVPIPALGRVTLNVEAEDASLANAAVATQVSATRPILVERAQYWPDPAPQWYEAHNSFGVTAVGTKWGLAEGRSGGPRAYQTYILLANPGTVKANVTITFLREGLSPVERTFEVSPRSRFNVDTGAVSELADLSFGAVITSDQPIAVERAMYNNANGQLWAAGTNATATPLP
jgi:autotransporter-associated beta strand protein